MLGKRPQIAANAFVAENATLIGDVVVAEESSIWFGAVLRGDSNRISIGKGSNIQDLCVLHVDNTHALTIGEGVTIGHRVILHGCSIGDYALIGMGAIVMNGAEVGEESLVAAGALITEGTKIPPRTLVVGFPAKVKRELTFEEIQGVHENSAHYVRMRALYRGE